MIDSRQELPGKESTGAGMGKCTDPKRLYRTSSSSHNFMRCGRPGDIRPTSLSLLWVWERVGPSSKGLLGSCSLSGAGVTSHSPVLLREMGELLSPEVSMSGKGCGVVGAVGQGMDGRGEAGLREESLVLIFVILQALKYEQTSYRKMNFPLLSLSRMC